MTNAPNIENSGQAIIEGDSIVIRVALSALPQIMDGWWACNQPTTRYKITNTAEFAADLVTSLNGESEDGTTRVHKMFDDALEYSIEQGAFGIEEHEDQDGP